MTLTFTEVAIAQLVALSTKVARHSPAYFKTLARRIVKRCQILKAHPRMGSEIEEYEDLDLRELYEKPYRILYRLVDEDFFVFGVVHLSQPLPRTPRG